MYLACVISILCFPDSFPRITTASRVAWLVSNAFTVSGVIKALTSSSCLSHLRFVVSRLYDADHFFSLSRRIMMLSFSKLTSLGLSSNKKEQKCWRLVKYDLIVAGWYFSFALGRKTSLISFLSSKHSSPLPNVEIILFTWATCCVAVFWSFCSPSGDNIQLQNWFRTLVSVSELFLATELAISVLSVISADSFSGGDKSTTSCFSSQS